MGAGWIFVLKCCVIILHFFVAMFRDLNSCVVLGQICMAFKGKNFFYGQVIPWHLYMQ